MDINLTSPALLFPAISLLMLAYTNRFLAIANLIRNLHATYRTQPNDGIPAQIANLRHRLRLIQTMQALAVFSALLGVLCMFVLFQGWVTAGKVAFGGSLVALMGSLVLSLREIQISANALNVQLSDMETGAVTGADEKRPAGQERPAGPL